MIAARLSSTLRDVPQRPLTRLGAQVYDRLLANWPAPLASAVDAPRHEIATADVGYVSYYADTSASGRPLVLLHGVHPSASAYDVRPLFESFRAQRPVYALDLPGFGFSERSPRRYTPALYVRAIEHLLRNVATKESADVIALSLSCEFVVKVAVAMPELVRSLVLISPTGFASPREMGRIERWARGRERAWPARVGGLPTNRVLYELLVARPTLGYLLRRSFEARLDDGVLAYAHATSHQLGAFRAPCAFIAGALYPAGDALANYGRVRTPVLVLYDRDPYTRFGQLERFTAEHANFRVQRISHTRGLPHFDAPQQTAEALRAFFLSVDQHAIDSLTGNGLHHTRFVGSA